MNMETPQKSMPGLEEAVLAWRPAAFGREYAALERGGAGVDQVVAQARAGLEAMQQADGHWVFELEADATMPAEYVFLEHFLGEIDQALEDKIAVYLRAGQADHGGWPLYIGGDFDISATVKAYFALKLIGDDPDAPHMARARAAILARGGAARCNVFTRISLALFGQVPWRAVPVMPVEIMLLPRWFPFHLDKVSYWSRTPDRAADDPDGVQAARAQSARDRDRGAVRHAAGAGARLHHQSDRLRLGTRLSGGRPDPAPGRAVLSQAHAPAGDPPGGRVHHRAAERRGWPGRDLSRRWPLP